MDAFEFATFFILAALAVGISSKKVCDCQTEIDYGRKSCTQYYNTKLRSANLDGIVPDVLDAVPKYRMEVEYDVGPVNLGNIIAPVDNREPPKNLAWPAKANKRYTMLFVDPDAPTRQDATLRSFLHWSVVDIPGCKFDQGRTIAEYIGAGPPSGTGLHRYVYVILEQSRKTNFESLTPIDNVTVPGRLFFSVPAFAEEFNLKVIAANYYNSEYDSSVDSLLASLGF